MQPKVMVLILGVALAVGLAGWMAFRTTGAARGPVQSAERAAQQFRPAQATPGKAPPSASPTMPPGWAVADDGAVTGANPNNAPGRRVVTSDGGPAPAWMAMGPTRGVTSFDFPRVRTSEEAGRALDNAFGDFARRAPTDDAPRGGWGSALEAWRRFTLPLVAEDEAGFRAVAQRLGAAPAPEGEDGAGDGVLRLYERLTAWLGGASVDLSSAQVRTVDPRVRGEVPRMPALPPGVDLPAGAVPMMMATNEMTDDAGVTRRTTDVLAPIGGVFPRAASALERGAPCVEVWAPARLSGQSGDEADVGYAAVLVFDQSTNAWIPVGLRMTLLTEAATERAPRAPGRG